MINEMTPPLENGDRLTRIEFERRYEAMPNLKNAELIEGVVYMPAALRFRNHGQPHANLIGWLWFYKIATPKVELGDNVTVRLDLDNAPQPDAVLMIDGGQASISSDDYVEGAPELVVEIAGRGDSRIAPTYDLYDKKRAYRRNGIREYLVWRVYENEFDWFYLKAGEYSKLEASDRGIIRSITFPGLWLAVEDLLSGNMPQVLAVLQQGLDSSEHQQFVKKLSQPE